MATETPFLYTDLISPDQIGTEEEETPKDPIIIRTWSRGSPFVKEGERSPSAQASAAGGMLSNEGMINYTALMEEVDQVLQNDKSNAAVEDGDNVLLDQSATTGGDEEEYHDDLEEGNDDDGSFDPNDEMAEFLDAEEAAATAAARAAAEEGNDEHQGMNMEDYFAKAEETENEEEYDSEYEDEEEEENESRDEGVAAAQHEEEDEEMPPPQYTELPHYGANADPVITENEGETGLEKMSLSHAELNLIAASSPAEDYNDLLSIMNEYNQLVTDLNSPSKKKSKTSAQEVQQQQYDYVSGDLDDAGAEGEAADFDFDMLLQQNSMDYDDHDDDDDDNNNKEDHEIIIRKKKKVTSKKTLITRRKSGDAVVARQPSGALQQQQHQQHHDLKDYDMDITEQYEEEQRQIRRQQARKRRQAAAEEQQKKEKATAFRAVNSKHKMMLADMAEKRKAEEQQLLAQANKAEARRKKFKEALLEKAMKARMEQSRSGSEDEKEVAAAAVKAQQEKKKKKKRASVDAGNGNAPGFLAPTKAFQVQSMPTKTAQQVLQSDEEMRRQEEEKYERVAALRRRFKDQHRKILSSLGNKNKEMEKKMEEAQQQAEIEREKRRKKAMKIVAEKNQRLAEGVDSRKHNSNASNGEDVDNGDLTTARSSAAIDNENCANKELIGKASNSFVRVSKSNREQRSTYDTEPAAGSALSAVRRRARSFSSPAADAGTNMGHAGKAPTEATILEGDAEQHVKSQQQRLALKEQQAKVQSYLQTITEQKKKEEEEKRKKEERAKRRKSLLSQRLLQEAAERKLMQANDPNPKMKYAAGASNQDTAMASERKESNSNAAKVQKQKEKPVKNAIPAASSMDAGDAGVSNSKIGSAMSAAPSDAVDKPLNASYNFEAPKVIKKPPKVTSEQNEKFVAKMKSDRSSKGDDESGTEGQDIVGVSHVPARDFADWKRKNGVPPDGLVFSMTGWYPCVRQALLDRGWHFNSDVTSPYFNLKWTLRSIDVCQESLQPWQLTNHYLKNVAITTKAGLIKSLNQLKWLADINVNDILPRGYDLSKPDEMQVFIDDFRCQTAERIIKELYCRATGVTHPLIGSAAANTTSKMKEESPTVHDESSESVLKDHVVVAEGNLISSQSNADSDNNEVVLKETPRLDHLPVNDEGKVVFPPVPPINCSSEIKINEAIFDVACKVLEKQVRPYEDNYIDQQGKGNEQLDILITDLEWELLSNYSIDATDVELPFEAPEPIDAFLKEKPDPDMKLNPSQQKEKRRKERQLQEQRDNASHDIRVVRTLTTEDVERMHFLLCKVISHSFVQSGINGRGKNSYNLWIVKPAAKSRGRGIATFMDLPKLLKYVDAGLGRYNSQWVVQKYIENPLVIAKRKFDLRQWVLVTNWNPLTVYFYDECYARFSVDEYSTNDSDLSNSYIHLVNNSISKNSEKFYQSIVAENGEEVKGYMWSFEQISSYLKDMNNGEDLMQNKIHPRMKDIAKWSLMCASEMIEHRKNSWELYGFDFMVDDEYNAWLIEINSSPACDYSTSVTERYVQKALVELLSVVLDCREWESQPKKSRGPCPDTGGWEKIYHGPLLDMPVGSFGTDLSIKGEGYKLPRASSLSTVNLGGDGQRSGSSRVHNILYNRPTASTLAATQALQKGRSGSGMGVSESSLTEEDQASDAELSLDGSVENAKNHDGLTVTQRKIVPKAPSAARGNNNHSGTAANLSEGYDSSSSINSLRRQRTLTGPSGQTSNNATETIASVTQNEKDDFDDSDEDSVNEKKKGTAASSASVRSVATGSKKVSSNKMPPGGKATTAAAPPGAAPIPIQVFNVEF